MTTAKILVAFLLVSVGACGDDDPAVPKDGPVMVDAGPDVDASCFDNPTTHEEIMNACTTAQKIYKDPTLPLLNPDGSLPPVP